MENVSSNNFNVIIYEDETYRKIPNATHNCHPRTKLPRIWAGEFSAASTGIVAAFAPMPKDEFEVSIFGLGNPTQDKVRLDARTASIR